jgi:hypothetical protein
MNNTLKEWLLYTEELQAHCYINDIETIMNKNSLDTQADAINAIRNQHYIVGSVSAQGSFSFSATPVVQYTVADARQECKRLANQNPGKLFVFVKLQGAELIPTTPTLSI